ncbi:hypothetical protein BJ878DRAFT_498260 [Calycina marina]|uniref:MARVEL domain-containing protein n=1 Tax=Calycina marina TaxID=1763456 RepID=A0A9P8CGE6_9HELO|nr:hypothetical protein BJ878DRAFT_498260 [Calycina marina]
MGFLDTFRRSKFYPTFLRILRFLQFASAISSLIVFSLRIRKLLHLYQNLSTATGAVEGILVAAVAYTLITTALTFCLKANNAPIFLRWALIVLDLAFVGAFIAVAVETRPNGGVAGLACYGEREEVARESNYVNDPDCRFPLGTFLTAIVSTLLHTLTLIFHEAKKHRHEHTVVKHQKEIDHENRNSEITDYTRSSNV